MSTSLDSDVSTLDEHGIDATPVEGEAQPTVRRRRFVLGGLVAAIVLIAGTAIYVASNEAPLPPKPDIPLDAWVPYWALDASLPEFGRRGPSMREVSPFWFNAVGVDQIIVDPNASGELTAQFMEQAERADVDVVPSIIDGLPAGAMAAILADPTTRAQHVEAIRAFAADGGYDGIDIDYEQFAFSDGRDTWAATRPNWVLFMEELGAALHATWAATRPNWVSFIENWRAAGWTDPDGQHSAGVRRRPDV